MNSFRLNFNHYHDEVNACDAYLGASMSLSPVIKMVILGPSKHANVGPMLAKVGIGAAMSLSGDNVGPTLF